MTADVEYDVDVLPDDVNVFGSPAEELLNESKCSRNRTCEVTTTVNVITSQQKRDSAFRVLVSMKINASFTYESYFTNRTIDNEKGKLILFGFVDIQNVQLMCLVRFFSLSVFMRLCPCIFKLFRPIKLFCI